MKKLIICLSIILVLVVGLFWAITRAENQLNLYEDVTQVTNVNQGNEGDYFVYFSKETCSHCEDVRSDVENFIETLYVEAPEVGFYLVDMDDTANSENFFATSEAEELVANVDYYIDPAAIPEGFNIDEFKIQGTPTLIYVSNGVITDIAVGATGEVTETTPMGVAEMLEKKATDLGFEFDANFNN